MPVNQTREITTFYDKQPPEQQEAYKHMLGIVGSLSRLFSADEKPYLAYRAHENIFARYFDVENNGRADNSADAYNSTSGIGLGLKTWVNSDTQKVAEFGRLRPQYQDLKGLGLVKKIAEYRNERIRVTKNLHGLHTLIYHVVKRYPGVMRIYEAAFDPIDVSNIRLCEDLGRQNSNYFTDGNHTYNFSTSKNTLYMIFDEMELLDEVAVEILEDPYQYLEQMIGDDTVLPVATIAPPEHQLCLRLYSQNKTHGKHVPLQSGMNQWNGSRTVYKKDENGRRRLDKRIPRGVDELYIPYPKIDRDRDPEFFPPKDQHFQLRLPDGTWITAKTCQEGRKAIMSSPNGALGKWLLRDVFELQERTVVTYEMLEKFDVDSVIFTRLDEGRYTVDFSEVGTYEEFYGIEGEE